MKTNRLVKFTSCVAAMAAALALGHPARAALNVFACEPEWAALARELGGDKVSVFQASTAMQDPHRIEARPSLIAAMRRADLMVCTGAELEVGWLPVLQQTTGNPKVQPGQPGYLLAADHVSRLEAPARLDRALGDLHPAGNPHIQLDPRNIAKVAAALSDRLAQLDAANAAYYQARGRDFQARWQQAIAEWERRATPLKGTRVVPYHRDTSYLIHWLGLVEVMTIEPKPGVAPSASHLTALLAKLQSEPAQAITRAAFNDPKAAEWLAERTKVPLVVLPYTVGGSDKAKDLYGLFDDTLDQLLKVKR